MIRTGVNSLQEVRQALQNVDRYLQQAHNTHPRWRVVPATMYTAVPMAASVIEMRDTSWMATGLPIRFTVGGVTYYAIIISLSADASITLRGPSLGAAALTKLEVGRPEMIVQHDFFVAGAYGDDVADLLGTDAHTAYQWGRSNAYLVMFSAHHNANDTGAAQPKVNIKVDGALVSTNDSNKGVQVTTGWVHNPATQVNTANYQTVRGDAIEVRCTQAGTNGNATDLTVRCLWVLE